MRVFLASVLLPCRSSQDRDSGIQLNISLENTDVPHTTDLLSRMTGSTKAVVGMASWDQ